MKRVIIRIIAAVLLLMITVAIMPINIFAGTDDLYNTWVATDALGRETPTNEKTGDKKQDKYVGIFYFMFMDQTPGKEVVDFSKAYEQGGQEAVWASVVTEGFHIWAEPYFGYYLNTDEWVIRRHAEMLSEAGVDFIYLDVTNTNMYPHSWRTIFRVWQAMRDAGQNTPQIVFCFGQGMYLDNMKIIWDEIYTPDADGVYKYEDLWFKWDGKPLLLGDVSGLTAEQQSFFTSRKSWAYQEAENGRWPWIQWNPQTPGYSWDGEMEQMSVAAGFHANASAGRSYVVRFTDNGNPINKQTINQENNGKWDFGYSLKSTEWGTAFAQQWEYAISQSPKIVMLTGWNEFTFGKWSGDGVGQRIGDLYTVKLTDPIFRNLYIDAMTAEFSRDIEPINGQFGDNYLYEMAEYIRLFKGTDSIPESNLAVDVNMSGDFSEFAGTSVYRDTTGDITHRDCDSIASLYHYSNTTGRNDFDVCNVSKTDENVYFYAECKDNITAAEGDNWMNLYINADRSYETGWEGYDYIINRTRDGSVCSVERFNGTDWEDRISVGNAEYSIKDNKIVIKVASTLISLDGRDSFDFKWADNSVSDGNVLRFMDLGDTAPNDRYRFRYIKTDGTYSDELLPLIKSEDDTTDETTAAATEDTSEPEDTTTDITVTDADTTVAAPVTEADSTAPVQTTDADGDAKTDGGISFGNVWIVVLFGDILLAAVLIICIVMRGRKAGER